MNNSSATWKNENKDFLDYLLKTAKDSPLLNLYFLAEEEYLKKSVNTGFSVIDFGCGNGRHLNLLKHKINRGLGIDLNQGYLEKASQLCNYI